MSTKNGVMKALQMIEDPRARTVLAHIAALGGEATGKDLEKALVPKFMARATLYNKLDDLHRDGWVFKEPRIKGNRAVLIYCAPGSILQFMKQPEMTTFEGIISKTRADLRDPTLSKEYKEGVAAGVLDGYLAGLPKGALQLLELCLKEGNINAFSKTWFWGAGVFLQEWMLEVFMLLWDHKEYGKVALQKALEAWPSLARRGRQEGEG